MYTGKYCLCLVLNYIHCNGSTILQANTVFRWNFELHSLQWQCYNIALNTRHTSTVNQLIPQSNRPEETKLALTLALLNYAKKIPSRL